MVCRPLSTYTPELATCTILIKLIPGLCFGLMASKHFLIKQVITETKLTEAKSSYYKSFENKLFRELLFELSNSTFEENADGFEEFIEKKL